ncbi:ATP-binding protein [Bradyrhizobium diazoefficiens]|nr:ATP-binding protein [Bradyrhizobium diazoefficiens]QQN65268.1 ATP-binding protein [Bradyrhizobium diazoefficiens]
MPDTARTGRSLPIEPYFGGFILETLTLGMYGESRNAIREYLQNAFDAIMQALKEGHIKGSEGKVRLIVTEDGLTIRDNGTGLRSRVAVDTLTSIGASKKDYRKEAGFRGIGRLAGIALCDKLTFRTKARKETIETIVEIDARNLRSEMSPARGGHLPLEELMMNNIKASQSESDEREQDGFFEVILQDFVDSAPLECSDTKLLSEFVGQVAPVPYAKEFTFAEDILRQGKKRNVSIDQVRVVLEEGDNKTEIFKPYRNSFAVVKDSVELNEVTYIESKSDKWWGWVGHKTEPGAYKDDTTKGIRIRVRNLQIDGTQIIGRIFENDIEGATSYGRFNDWFVGEIFVDPTYLVPNARRDHFEDDKNWREMRKELGTVCEGLGKEAYEISRKNQHSLKKLASDTKELQDDGKKLFVSDDPSPDKLIEISSRANKIQRRIARALRNADNETTSQLRSLENKLLDVKTDAVRKLGLTQALDIDEARQEAQDELASSLVEAFKEVLDSRCYGKARKAMEDVLGRSDF